MWPRVARALAATLQIKDPADPSGPIYDANGNKVASKFANVSNGASIATLGFKVTARITDFNSGRGVGCHMHALGHAWELTYRRSGAARRCRQSHFCQIPSSSMSPVNWFVIAQQNEVPRIAPAPRYWGLGYMISRPALRFTRLRSFDSSPCVGFHVLICWRRRFANLLSASTTPGGGLVS